MDAFAEHIAWMAWTWQTVVFFALVAASLTVLIALAVKRPETPRVGVLGFATTRGDRFFVSLLAAAFIFLGFIRFGGGTFLYPAIASLVVAAVMFRFA